MPDEFGIPDHIFGQVGPDFYGVIGRITMLAALLETKIERLIASIDHRVQESFAGLDVAAIIGEAQALLTAPLPARPALPDETRAAISALLDDVREAMRDRNAVIHSVWPQPSLQSAVGWRSLRTKLRGEPEREQLNEKIRDWTSNLHTTERTLPDIVLHLVYLLDRVTEATQSIESVPRVAVTR